MKKTITILKIIKYLLSLKKNFIFEISKAELIKEFNINKRTLNRYLNELQESGFIELVPMYKMKKQKILIK